MGRKINPDSLIAAEIEDLDDKVKEFQKYLRLNTIVSKVSKSGISLTIDEIMLSEEQQDKLHKEILIQIKMQDALFVWLPLLKKLRETEEGKQLETRGDVKVNGMFKNRNNNNGE